MLKHSGGFINVCIVFVGLDFFLFAFVSSSTLKCQGNL